ncbi:tyrosine-type recombinase/integrase [Halobacillus litoralis]|uniref:Site-specific integrase n=1 Tax=Halobacillus litoralis TaxID=45668 RepID=A0A410MDR5_9BACI|nr:site-specific integrase [Halobacillus litoralis]QAS52843.1 hypothetical protein HLI_11870 [Halobacillus litoralis]
MADIYKTADGYGFRASMGKDPVTGRYIQKRFSGYTSKTQARQEKKRIELEVKQGTYLVDQDITLGDFLKEWLNHKGKHVTEGTMSHYRPYINKHLIPYLGHVEIGKLKPSHIQQLYDYYVEEELLTNQSIKHMHRVLHNAYNTAIKWEYVAKNPCLGATPPAPEKRMMQTWDEVDIETFLEENKEHRLYTFYLLSLSTGMRKGELLGLTWNNIDFTNNMLAVTQAIRKKKGGGYEIGKVKTKHAERTISLFDHVNEALKKHKREQMAYKMSNRQSYKDADLVFATSNGTHFNPHNIQRYWMKSLEESAVKTIRFHDMRHTHATLLLKMGVHPKVVQERLGHSSITVTLDLYSHVMPNIQKEAATDFGEKIFGHAKTKNDSL